VKDIGFRQFEWFPRRVVALRQSFHSEFLIDGRGTIFCFAGVTFGLQSEIMAPGTNLEERPVYT
jgi:hypothetical protein